MSFKLISLFPDPSWDDIVKAVENGHSLDNSGRNHVELNWNGVFNGVFPSQEQLNLLKKGGLLECRADSSSNLGMTRNTLLNWAVFENNIEYINRVLDAGINIDLRGFFGLTALNATFDLLSNQKKLPVEAVCFLLEKGASPNANGLGAVPQVCFHFVSMQSDLYKYCSSNDIDTLWDAFDRANTNWLAYEGGDQKDGGYPLQTHLIYEINRSNVAIHQKTAKRLVERGLSFNGRFKMNNRWDSYRSYANRIGPIQEEFVKEIQTWEKSQVNQKKLQEQTMNVAPARRSHRF